MPRQLDSTLPQPARSIDAFFTVDNHWRRRRFPNRVCDACAVNHGFAAAVSGWQPRPVAAKRLSMPHDCDADPRLALYSRRNHKFWNFLPAPGMNPNAGLTPHPYFPAHRATGRWTERPGRCDACRPRAGGIL